MFTYATPTFITEAIIVLASTMHFNSKTPPTIHNDCSRHIKAVEFVLPIIWSPYHATNNTHTNVHTEKI